MTKSTEHLDNRKKQYPPTELPGVAIAAELHAMSAMVSEFFAIMLIEMPEGRRAKVLADLMTAADRARARTSSEKMQDVVPFAAETLLTEILKSLQNRAAGGT